MDARCYRMHLRDEFLPQRNQPAAHLTCAWLDENDGLHFLRRGEQCFTAGLIQFRQDMAHEHQPRTLRQLGRNCYVRKFAPHRLRGELQRSR